MSIQDYLRILRRRGWIVVLAVVLEPQWHATRQDLPASHGRLAVWRNRASPYQ